MECKSPDNGSEIERCGSLYEYSVVYSDRVYNLMSDEFGESMRYILKEMKETYHAEEVVLIPGSGTYAMEAVARQFCANSKVVTVRNGLFSHRWSEIFRMCQINTTDLPILAQKSSTCPITNKPLLGLQDENSFFPFISSQQPAVVTVAHVETATGLKVPDKIISQIGKTIQKHNGLLILDCIASGMSMVNMQELNVDILVTAPQKTWSSEACVGIICLGPRALQALSTHTHTSSFCCNLPNWLDVSRAYSSGGFKYYTTLPTNAIMDLSAMIKKTKYEMGLSKATEAMLTISKRVLAGLKDLSIVSVVVEEYQAPSVLVVYLPSHITTAQCMSYMRTKSHLQLAAGVKWFLEEEKMGVDSALQTVRIGLFGLYKYAHVDQTVEIILEAFKGLCAAFPSAH